MFGFKKKELGYSLRDLDAFRRQGRPQVRALADKLEKRMKDPAYSAKHEDYKEKRRQLGRLL